MINSFVTLFPTPVLGIGTYFLSCLFLRPYRIYIISLHLPPWLVLIDVFGVVTRMENSLLSQLIFSCLSRHGISKKTNGLLFVGFKSQSTFAIFFGPPYVIDCSPTFFDGIATSLTMLLALSVERMKNRCFTYSAIDRKQDSFGLIFAGLCLFADFFTLPLKHWLLHNLATNDLIQWRPGAAMWVILNVDGALNPSSSIGSAGGLFRDHEGSWLLGFNKHLGFERVQSQTDSSEAYALITSCDASSSPISLVHAIVDYTSKSWMLDYVLIKWEANFAADFLAKYRPISDGSTFVYYVAPAPLMPILVRDLHGPPFPRHYDPML
ncbi:hypothetical protein V6N11_025796 [Hibiscus sabdariffa]|uniref:RNase H type-1 domain-containing protein n=1 Tax=Hibiscus sabdariffa TaxID=183260 RepID=A0ABR2SUK3_9ROSI